MSSRSRKSPACENCRRRRIKCNQLRPQCSQCARAGLSCSGYREPIDLLFQDQTATVARKFRKDPNLAVVESETDCFCVLSSPSSNSSTSLTLVNPTTHVEEIASKYFFTNFNITRNKPVALPEPWLASSPCGLDSVTSVGLAAMAIIRQDPHMMALARRRYSAALRHLALAVQDPLEVTKGPTTTTSFNMSMFEMIISDGPDTAYEWLKHIRGTTALMRVVQFPFANAIFAVKGCLQVCFTIAVASLISETPVPPYVINVPRSFSYPGIYAEIPPIIELFSLLSRLVNLYILAKQIGNNSPRDLSSALSDIDEDLVSWTARLPSVWTGDPNTGSKLLDGPESTNWLPRLWGYYRLCRVITHQVILDNAHWSLGKEELSREIISRMSHEIYASIPSMLRKPALGSCTGVCLGLTSDVFFLITILQALLKVTDKQTVMDEWAVSATETIGKEEFGPVRGFVERHLC
ncbi:hypothetical protein BJX66DRAFT_315434 [Aspergillus keveii]|uniref:Zn(2)-C6 fungal-type domain-containing protein n=1 Tax=Aspergillus keveii TaxID=714993 RepID=A0ABR4FPJ3_9EURO